MRTGIFEFRSPKSHAGGARASFLGVFLSDARSLSLRLSVSACPYVNNVELRGLNDARSTRSKQSFPAGTLRLYRSRDTRSHGPPPVRRSTSISPVPLPITHGLRPVLGYFVCRSDWAILCGVEVAEGIEPRCLGL